MRIPSQLLFLILITAWITASQPTRALEMRADALAKIVLEKAGITATVCEMPRVGDGTLAAALAQAGVAQVHALAPDDKSLAAGRAPAIAAGVLGSQVIIETGKPDALTLGDWVADLYLVADATDVNLKTLSAAEAGRVLAPYRGVALVGNPSGRKSGLSIKALQDWVKGIGGTADIKEDASGLWAVVKIPPLPGGDDWSHFYHAPDANPVSQDTAFHGPEFQIQWHDFPLRTGGRSFTTVVSAGRLFIANCSLFQGAWAMSAQMPLEIDARNLYNGKLLWRRPLSLHFGDMGSLMVAMPDRLYVKEGAAVLVLNPETGVEISRITAAKAPQQVRWLALANGVLLTLAGPMALDPDHDLDTTPNPTPEQMGQRAAVWNATYYGQGLAAWDAQTGKALWRNDEARISIRRMSASNGRVFLYVNDRDAEALDIHSGRPLWKTASPMPDQNVFKFKYEYEIAGPFRGEPLALSSPKVYAVNDPLYNQYHVFDATNGNTLWSSDGKSFGNFPLLMGDTLISKSPYLLDVMSGKQITKTLRPRAKNGWDDYGCMADSCGHATAVASGWWIGGGVWDMKTGIEALPFWRRTACGVGYFVADGVQVMHPNTCGCVYIKGTFIVRPAAPERTPATPRLEPGDAPAPAVTRADAGDWTTYRSDETRKGSSFAVIPPQAGVRWTYTPPCAAVGTGMVHLPNHLERDRFATQVIAVGDRLWFGTADGAVICLDRQTGVQQWAYWSAGHINATPVWADGRIYAGSADGWLYCLDAATGKLAWRFRVAPQAERRISYMGGMASAWPVQAILVHDGVVYATAGELSLMDGSVMCAVDANSGQERWTKVYQDLPNDKQDGTYQSESPSAGGGQLAWYAGKIWWMAGPCGPTIVDPATGAWHLAIDDSYLARFGQKYASWQSYLSEEVGILPGGWVAIGNDPFTHAGRTLLLQAGADGVPAGGEHAPQLLMLEQVNRQPMSRDLPAWDGNELLFLGAKKMSPVMLGGFAEVLNQQMAAHPINTDGKKRFEISEGPNGLVRPLALDQPNIKQHPLVPDAIWKSFMQGKQLGGDLLMAGNAVALTARGEDYFPGFYGRFINYGSWQVGVFSRADGSLLFEAVLPDAPARSGMSLTGKGDLLIPLQDGRIVCIGDGATPLPVAANDTAITAPGLRMDGYVSDIPGGFYHSWSEEDLSIMAPSQTQVANTARIADDTDPTQAVLWLRGFVEVPETGVYHFSERNGRGVAARFHVLDAGGRFTEGAFLEQGNRTESVLLAKGKHPISWIVMRDQNGQGASLYWDGPGIPHGEIPSTALSHVPPSAMSSVHSYAR